MMPKRTRLKPWLGRGIIIEHPLKVNPHPDIHCWQRHHWLEALLYIWNIPKNLASGVEPQVLEEIKSDWPPVALLTNTDFRRGVNRHWSNSKEEDNNADTVMHATVPAANRLCYSLYWKVLRSKHLSHRTYMLLRRVELSKTFVRRMRNLEPCVWNCGRTMERAATMTVRSPGQSLQRAAK